MESKMANIMYIKNTKKFRKQQLPEIIDKYKMIMLPFKGIGNYYVGNGVNIIVDKQEVRIDVYQKGVNFTDDGLK